MARSSYFQALNNNCKAPAAFKANLKAVESPLSGKARKLAGTGGQPNGDGNETVHQALVRIMRSIPPHKQLRVLMLLFTVICIYNLVEQDKLWQAERQVRLARYKQSNTTTLMEATGTLVTEQEEECDAQQQAAAAEVTSEPHQPTPSVSSAADAVPTASCSSVLEAGSGSSVDRLSAFACVVSGVQQQLAHTACIISVYATALFGITSTLVEASRVAAVAVSSSRCLSSVYRLVSPRSSVAA